MTEAVTFDLEPDEREVFLQEVEDHLQVLDEDIIRLEREGDDQTLLQEIFRAAHTLKGASATIGHQRMTALTHAMETVLDGLRKGALQVNPSMTDLLLEGLDLLRGLREEVVTGKKSPIDIAQALEGFRQASQPSASPVAPERPVGSIPLNPPLPKGDSPSPPLVKGDSPSPPLVKGDSPSPPLAKGHSPFPPFTKGGSGGIATESPATKSETEDLPSGREDGGQTYEVRVHFAKKTFAPAIRALQVVMELGQLGEVLSSSPTAEEIDAQKVNDQIRVILLSREEKERVHLALDAIMDLEKIEVLPRPPSGNELQESGGAGGRRRRGAEAQEGRGARELEGGEAEGQRDGKTAKPPGSEAGEPERGTDDVCTISAKEERELNFGPRIVGLENDRRQVDLGPTSRGKGETAALENAASRQPARATGTVRISVERLDKLVDLIGELVTYRNRLFKIGSDLAGHYGEDGLVETLREASSHIGSITDQLQTEVMKARMFPLESVCNKFPRLVRDLARKAGKDIELLIQGQETELDRSVIEIISDPLIHLLRNAVDHGIESPENRQAASKPATGTVRLAARHEEGHIVITVEDDGNGIDPQRLKEAAVSKGLIPREEAEKMSEEDARELLFLPGLSTAKTVSDVSGRGVGMDVVKTNIERVGGSIVIHSEKGHGTRFALHLPLTLAILPTLLVSLQGRTYLIPLASVIEIVRVHAKEIKTIQDREVIQLRGLVLPLLRLGKVLGLNGAVPSERCSVVVIKGGDILVGLVVDSLLGQEEVVIKSLGGFIGELKAISGATILGDGRVGLIVDVQGIIEIARRDQRLTGGTVRR